MSLTDRMAAALRDVMSNGGEADTVAAFAVLAEYDASRAAPAASYRLPQVGQHVRILRHADWGDEGTVIRVSQALRDRQPGVVVQTPDGAYQKLFPGEYEIIPNLPATNTGD